MFSAIVAMDKNGVIGNKGDIPWHIPEDMMWFQRNTFNKIVIMGKNTFHSIGKQLPNRTNIVVTTSIFSPILPINEELIYCSDLDSLSFDLLDYKEEIIVIGGEQIYKYFIPSLTDRLYITFVDGEFKGDTYFPLSMNEINDLYRLNYIEHMDNSKHKFKFMIYDRR